MPMIETQTYEGPIAYRCPIARQGRGYFAVGIFQTKDVKNVGTLWRSAHNFGAAFIFTIGKRYKSQNSDTCKTPRHIPLFHYEDLAHFQSSRPDDCSLIGIEQAEGVSRPLKNFQHPERAIYLLGAEDDGIPPEVLARCRLVVHISTPMCLNVSVAGSVVMYDRSSKLLV